MAKIIRAGGLYNLETDGALAFQADAGMTATLGAADDSFTIKSGANTVISLTEMTGVGGMIAVGGNATNTSAYLVLAAYGASDVSLIVFKANDVDQGGLGFDGTDVIVKSQETNALKLYSMDQSEDSTNSAAVSIYSGNAAGATSNSGSVSISSGTATGTRGNIALDSHATTVDIEDDSNFAVRDETNAETFYVSNWTAGVSGIDAVVAVIEGNANHDNSILGLFAEGASNLAEIKCKANDADVGGVGWGGTQMELYADGDANVKLYTGGGDIIAELPGTASSDQLLVTDGSNTIFDVNGDVTAGLYGNATNTNSVFTIKSNQSGTTNAQLVLQGYGAEGGSLIDLRANGSTVGYMGKLTGGTATFVGSYTTNPSYVAILGSKDQSTSNTGTVSIQSGPANGDTYSSGTVSIYTGQASGATSGDSGDLSIYTSSANAGDSGAIALQTGSSTSGNSGNISITTSSAAAGVGGNINLTTGTGSSDANRGDVQVFTGDMTVKLGTDDGTSTFTIQDSTTGGIFTVDSDGNGYFDGNVDVNGNLTVQGSITSIESTEVLIGDSVLVLNSEIDQTAENNNGGFYVSRVAGAGSFTTTSFTNATGVIAMTDDPTSQIAAGDLIVVIGSEFNDGIFKVSAVDGSSITINAAATEVGVRTSLTDETVSAELNEFVGALLYWSDAQVGGDNSWKIGRYGTGATLTQLELTGIGANDATACDENGNYDLYARGTSNSTSGADYVGAYASGWSKISTSAHTVQEALDSIDGQLGVAGIGIKAGTIDINGVVQNSDEVWHTYGTAFANTNYALNFSLEGAADTSQFTWNVIEKATTGFKVQFSGNIADDGTYNLSWTATPHADA